MILITNTDEEWASARHALQTIESLRNRRNTLPERPDTQDTPWVRTAWPHEWYL